MFDKVYLRLIAILLVGALALAGCANGGVETTESDEDSGESVNIPDDVTAAGTLPIPPTLKEDEKVENSDVPASWLNQFSTDFSISVVDFDEILSGGPPKDGIPAVDNPQFVSAADADEWLVDEEPVVIVTHKGETRAYPIQILMWHEIVNDRLGGEPVTVTFCPLCNTAIVFSGLVDKIEMDFGTTGRLRYSNLIMYDRQTETWWQQATGEAIVGRMTGRQLTFLPAAMISWKQFKESHPDAEVLSQETGYVRRYGNNPYTGYDNINVSPFLYRGPETPGQLPAMARVLTVDLNGEAVAYPYDVMEKIGVVNDTVGGENIVVVWQPGVASALDASTIASGRDVGTVAAFSQVLDGVTLTFSMVDGEIVDDQTGSVWNVLGEAINGELAGSQLETVVSINHFWFSWAAFRPETRVFTVQE